MKFGQVENPEIIDFKIPKSHSVTLEILKENKSEKALNVFVGCAKWNKTDLKGFYPRGTKDELAYYSRQFNSIELNATFYNAPSVDQVKIWKEKTPDGFKFFPKIPQSISHFGRLLNTKDKVESFCNSISHFDEKLGMVFLQMHDNYAPKDFARLESFLHDFPKEIPLALEVRNKEWFSNEDISKRLHYLLQEKEVTNIIVDTAGRRDMMHMRLTTPTAFVRYVGANTASDYSRLDEWIERLVEWKEAGLQNLYFFIHQNVEVESPLLAAHFIKKINEALEVKLHLPQRPQETLPLFD